jgi:rhodanese-related sulfurtransferase
MEKMTEKGRIQGIVFRMFWQTGSIVLLAVILAVLVNQIRSDQLPLVADWSPEARLTLESGESMVISIEEARELCSSKKAIFLDARSSELYEHGHILCARNLPWNAVDEHFGTVMADIHQDALIITYCDGESCTLSKDLSLELFYRGYENVRVLVNGWSLWVDHQLPVEKGPWHGEF